MRPRLGLKAAVLDNHPELGVAAAAGSLQSDS